MSSRRSSSVSSRALQAAIALAAAVAVGSFAAWLPPFVRNLARGVTNGVLGGNDFAMYHAASALGGVGRWSDAYSLEGLAEAMGLRLGAASFAYPPLFAQAISPLASTDYPTALSLWFAASVLIVVVGIPLVFGRAGLIAMAAMSYPLYVALRFGQFVPFALGALLLAHVALRRGRPFMAGVALGFLVLKPQFLVGLVIITVFDRRSRPVLRGMVTSVVPALVLSYTFDPSAWSAFVTGLTETTTPSVSSSWDYSLLRLLRPLPVPLLVGIYATTAALLSWMCVRAAKSTHSIEAKLALALALGVALSPRMLVYDWSLLIAAGVWLAAPLASMAQLRWLTAGVIVASLSGHPASPFNFGWIALAAAVIGVTGALWEARSPYAVSAKGAGA